MTQPMRTKTGSISKYSAIPPATPVSILSVVLRRSLALCISAS